MTSIQASAYDWREKYGLQGCDNPIFTRPNHEVEGGRVQGAGINMNDGEAYQEYYIGFSSEWHYAPKLYVSPNEAAVLPRVLGMGCPLDHEMLNYLSSVALKFNAKRINGCSALVAYRLGANGPGELKQYLAVYNENATLTDAMLMGTAGLIDSLFAAQPHGDYSVSGRWWNISGKINDTIPEHNEFTLEFSNYYKNAEGKDVKWLMTRYYHVDPDGHIIIDKVEQENAPQFNERALELFELHLTPLAGYEEHILNTLNKLQLGAKQNEALKQEVNSMFTRLYSFNPQAFYTWGKANPKSSLVGLYFEQVRKRSYEFDDPFFPLLVDKDIDGLNDKALGKYWKNLLKSKKINGR